MVTDIRPHASLKAVSAASPRISIYQQRRGEERVVVREGGEGGREG